MFTSTPSFSSLDQETLQSLFFAVTKPSQEVIHFRDDDIIFQTASYTANEDIDEDPLEDEVSDAPSFFFLEAKRFMLEDSSFLDHCVGQLFAQMIDVLNVKKRKLSETEEFPTKDKIVKGILSTGQHSLFFLLRRVNNTDPKPTMEFYGKFSVKVFNILPKRSSGLGNDKYLDIDDIERYLKNLYYFLNYIH